MWKKFKEEKPEPITDIDTNTTTYPESEVELQDILNELSDNGVKAKHIKVVNNPMGIHIYYFKDLNK